MPQINTIGNNDVFKLVQKKLYEINNDQVNISLAFLLCTILSCCVRQIALQLGSQQASSDRFQCVCRDGCQSKVKSKQLLLCVVLIIILQSLLNSWLHI